MKKDKSLTIAISSKHLEDIKNMAKLNECSVSNLVISKTLGIPLKEQPEIKEYTTKKYIPKTKKSL